MGADHDANSRHKFTSQLILLIKNDNKTIAHDKHSMGMRVHGTTYVQILQ